ncbi:MAG TPA: helicase, partial [Verrucomicrobiales bacterium]|nr:helicase [Verrucomicrobiales bacterium]
MADLLDTLAGHPRVTSGKTKAVQVSLDCPELSLHAGLCDNGEIKLSIRGFLEDPLLIRGSNLWMLQDYSFLRLPVPDSLSDLLSGEQVIPRYEVPAFLNGDYNRLKNEFSLTSDFELDQFDWNPMEPKIVLELKGGLAQLAGSIQFVYGSRVFQSGKNAEDSSAWFPDPDSPTVYSTRNLSCEKRAMERLRRVGFSAPDAQSEFEMLGRPTVLSFFAGEYGRMCREWEVSLEERLHRSTEKNIVSIEPRFEIRASGEQWFEMDIRYVSSDGQTFSQVEVQDLLRSGKGYRPMNDGRMAMIDTGAVEEFQEVLRDSAPMQKDGTYRFSNAQAGFLYNSLKENQAWRLDASADWKNRALIQSGEIQPDVPDLGKLNDVARPYQKNGIGWMNFLRSNGFGGILADEMGLGKTLQALAFLAVVKKMSSKETHLPSLVVCPTSLVFNWQAEAEKFTPELTVLALNGTNRHRLFCQIPEADLVITSYALIRRDLPKYAELSFDTLILDEAQHIKNRETRNAQAVKSIRAGHRLVLTGTPLENSVLDLWSIFDFLMPGYLSTAKDFKERFELAITHEKDGNTRRRLARRIRPFLLRREKSEVAADLPEKIEQISFCELSKDQKALYQQILETGQSQIGQASGDGSNPKNRMMVLQTLLRLRQICCDLRLLKLPDLKTKNPSGKLELFEELLEEILDGGHRVLVFSQFVKMLHLIRTRLEERGVPYSYLDGQTGNRKAVVDVFQGRSDIPVFLISLKAGGLGLNLTAADTVIHFDPWWNPAVENQATDRVHRIGQTRVVTSYKMIARGTVEEKIL